MFEHNPGLSKNSLGTCGMQHRHVPPLVCSGLFDSLVDTCSTNYKVRPQNGIIIIIKSFCNLTDKKPVITSCWYCDDLLWWFLLSL